jgi:hypothetical protein
MRENMYVDLTKHLHQTILNFSPFTTVINSLSSSSQVSLKNLTPEILSEMDKVVVVLAVPQKHSGRTLCS